MNFALALKDEFGCEQYVSCIRDGRVEIYYTLYFQEPRPRILMIFDRSGQDANACSLWEAELTDSKILQHMEEEVGIDSSGLETFAGYFCDAILAKPSLSRDPLYFPENPEAKSCAISLSYNLAGTNLEGAFIFDLIQKDLNKGLVEMFQIMYQTDKQNQINPSTRVSRPRKQKLTRLNTDKETKNTSNGVPAEEEETVVKAKKRKVGGVSIFPGKKVTFLANFLFGAKLFENDDYLSNLVYAQITQIEYADTF